MTVPNCETQAFSPRQLAHANLFVHELERTMLFYNSVAGLEEVRREPAINAGFLSNGNSHHDIGVSETTQSEREGLGGHVQVTKGRASKPGLNHLGWEMENEAALVSAYRRWVDIKTDIHRRADHHVAHSIYIFDPEGNLNEFYADAVRDWRTIFNPTQDDLITEEWPVDTIQMGDSERKFDPLPRLKYVTDSVLHSLRFAGAVLAVRDLESMADFYQTVGGLRPVDVDAANVRLLTGSLNRSELGLVDAAVGLKPGLHHLSFELPANTQIQDLEQPLTRKGVTVERTVDTDTKTSIFVRDPDNILIEFVSRRTAPRLLDVPSSELAYHL